MLDGNVKKKRGQSGRTNVLGWTALSASSTMDTIDTVVSMTIEDIEQGDDTGHTRRTISMTFNGRRVHKRIISVCTQLDNRKRDRNKSN